MSTPIPTPKYLGNRESLERFAEELVPVRDWGMKTYSTDLRERRLQAIDAGLGPAEAARLFGVGSTTITRWQRQRRERGTLAPRPRPGRRRRIGPEGWPVLEAQLRAAPAATLGEHCAAWEHEQGVRVSVATISRAVRRRGWTVKKRS